MAGSSVDYYSALFHNSGATVAGSIFSTTSSTAFNTSSDHRMKENVVDMTGAITRVKQLAPKRFNFIIAPEKTVDGFLAHETQTVVPEAVTGTHNEVNDDGNAVMQGIDLGEAGSAGGWSLKGKHLSGRCEHLSWPPYTPALRTGGQTSMQSEEISLTWLGSADAGGPLSGRNLVTNGACRVAQRYTCIGCYHIFGIYRDRFRTTVHRFSRHIQHPKQQDRLAGIFQRTKL